MRNTGILRRNANRAAARMTVIAVASLDADFVGIIGNAFDVLVAIERHQHRMADGDRIGAERQGLCHIATITNAAGIDERNLALLAQFIDGAACLADRGDAGDARILGRDMRACAGAAFHGIDVNRVRPAFHRAYERRHRRVRRQA